MLRLLMLLGSALGNGGAVANARSAVAASRREEAVVAALVARLDPPSQDREAVAGASEPAA